MHQSDVFKVGYTTLTPEERVQNLNTEQRNRTSQIGFFVLAFKRPVNDAYRAEQRLFAVIDQYRVTRGKEFFRLPLEELAAAMLAAADESNARDIARWRCPNCGDVWRSAPLPDVEHRCDVCGARFTFDRHGQVITGRPARRNVESDIARRTMLARPAVPTPAAQNTTSPQALPAAPAAAALPLSSAGAVGMMHPRSDACVVQCPLCGHLQVGIGGVGRLMKATCPSCRRPFQARIEAIALGGTSVC